MPASFFLPGVDRDRAYVATRDLPEWEDLRTRVEAVWRRYEPICGDDPAHFLNDAACQFHARTWEMYVGCTLMDHGFVLERPPPDGPDHLVRIGGRPLWVEDTATEKGTGPDAVCELPQDGEMHEIKYDSLILRYSAAIRAKWEQWCKFLRRGSVVESDPYVVAVNGAALTWAGSEYGVPAIVRTVFALDRPQFVWNREANNFGDALYPIRREVLKASGAAVPTEFFANVAWAGISGLFFSAQAIWNAPAQFGDDLLFVHNPHARNPLPRGTFHFGTEWWFDPEDECVHRHPWSTG